MSMRRAVAGGWLGVGFVLVLGAACGSTVTKPAPSSAFPAGEGGAGSNERRGSGGAEEAGHSAAGADSAVGATVGEAGAREVGPGGYGGGAGAEGEAGAAGGAAIPPATCRNALAVVFRDFQPYGSPSGHDDFEASARGIKNLDGSLYKGWNDIGCGLVEPALGQDGKPRAFAGAADVHDGVTLPGLVGRQRRTVSGPGCFTAANQTPAGACNIGSCSTWDITPPTYSIKNTSTFNQWFNTVEGVNIEVPADLVLSESSPGSGIWSFDSDAFFPLDGKGFGNSAGLAHNYSFTTEAHATFTYLPGQMLTFRGDDDLWIFVNGKLALDVGGQHQQLTGIVDLDHSAASLGITPGQTYELALFHAERQSPESTFHLSTNIGCFRSR